MAKTNDTPTPSQDAPKVKLTQDLILPPGSVVTPDHVVVENAANSGYSDRHIGIDGAVIDPAGRLGEHLSTYKGPTPPVSDVAPNADFGPGTVNGPVSAQ